jgi:chromosomal replication initiation ATPase DnaA
MTTTRAKTLKDNFISPYAFAGMEIKPLKPKDIIDIVCNYYNVKFKDVDNRDRHNNIIEVRQAIMYYLHHNTKLTLYGISDCFTHKCHHSSVLNNIGRYNDLLSYDKTIQKQHEVLNKLLINTSRLH